jgi:hypothetical protein
MLMAMDEESFAVRWKCCATPREILAKLSISYIRARPGILYPDEP